jgi:hypothetical protein
MSIESKSILGWAAAAVLAVVALAVGYGAGRSDSGRTDVGRPEVGAPAPEAVTARDRPGGAEAEEVTAGEIPESESAEPGRAASGHAPSAPDVEPVETADSSTEVPTARMEALPDPAPVVDLEDEEEQPLMMEDSEPSPPRVETVELAPNTALRIRLTETVSSRTAVAGDSVVGELSEEVSIGGRVVLAEGTRVRGRVVEAQALKKIGGRARLALRFERLVADLETVSIEADWALDGRSETGKDAATIAAGAAAGAVVGNQARKNKRGKVLGALIGAAAGAAVARRTEGEEIELPVGTVLEVELIESVALTVELDEPGG